MVGRVRVRLMVAAVVGVGVFLPAVAMADPSAGPVPDASGSPSAPAEPTLPAETTPPAEPTPPASGAAAGMPRTNLQAVVDPIAVQVRDGVRIRVGMRNAGPRSITAPAGTPATTFNLYIVSSAYINRVRSVGGCGYLAETPPRGDPPVIDVPVSFFTCVSDRTLRVGETFWQAFVFPDLSGFGLGVTIIGSGYADDPVPGDNSRRVQVRLGGTDGDPGLPVTGPAVASLAGSGLALIAVGVLVLRLTRRRRAPGGSDGQPAGTAAHHDSE